MIDFRMINDTALHQIESLCRFLAPGGRIEGSEYCALNPIRSDRRVGSFSVTIRGPNAGKWHERAVPIGGGDPVSLWSYLNGTSQPEGARQLAEWLRLPTAEGPRKEKVIPFPSRVPAEDPATRLILPHQIWSEGRNPRFTAAEGYVEDERGLELPDELCGRLIRYCPSLWLSRERPVLRGMIASFRPVAGDHDPDDPPTGILRWWFGADGRCLRRDDGRRLKKALGIIKDCALKLSPDDEVTEGLVVTEGFETALSALNIGLKPVWALGNAGAIETLPVLSGVGTLVILADHDRSGVGESAAATCAQRWRKEGREVVVHVPRGVGNDFADLSAREQLAEIANGFPIPLIRKASR